MTGLAHAAPVSGVPVQPGLFVTEPTGPSFLGCRCRRCGAAFWPQRPACGRCTAMDLAPERLGPEGRLYSYTLVRQAPSGYAGAVPYLIAIAVFAGEVKISGQLAADPAAPPPLDCAIRMNVEAVAVGPDGVPILGWRFYPEPDGTREHMDARGGS